MNSWNTHKQSRAHTKILHGAPTNRISGFLLYLLTHESRHAARFACSDMAQDPAALSYSRGTTERPPHINVGSFNT
jgi:hypothetical protein